MSSADARGEPEARPSCAELIALTLRGCQIARSGAAAISQDLCQRPSELLAVVRQCEEELDSLSRQINEGISRTITRVSEAEGRQELACLKFIIDLERIGDLFLNVVNRAQILAAQFDRQDANVLCSMASVIERMLGDVSEAFEKRAVSPTLLVLRADAEVDRLRNLVFLRHIENRESGLREGSFHLLFMTQSLERAGDHVKNMAAEVCQLVTGQSMRHLMKADHRSLEERFVDEMRRRGQTS